MLRPTRLAFRAADLEALDALADEIEGVVIVVTGPPGVGKSALARAFAAQRSPRAQAVDLGAVTTVAELEDALAALRGGSGDDALPEVLVADDVRSKLIGDVFAKLAERTPETTVLVTARDRSIVPSARVHDVRALATDDATKLLETLAREADPAWSPSAADGAHLRAIAELSSGLPLGIVLAAARVPVMGARALHFRLEKSFEVLARDASGGRSALELSIRSALEALEPGPREALSQLALFDHPFAAAAAEATVRLAAGRGRVLDALEALRGASLLDAKTIDGEVRFSVPTAIARVAIDEARRPDFDERHAEYFASLAERGDRDELLRERDQILDVARRILTLKPLTTRRAEPALRALLGLGPRLFDGASLEALHAISEPTLTATRGSGARPLLIAGIQWLRGAIARRRGDERASVDLVAALSVAKTLHDPLLEARCTFDLGHLLAARGELAEAETHFVQASDHLLGEERLAALAAAADAARDRGDLFQATLHVVRAKELDGNHPAVLEAESALLLDEGDARARAKVRGLLLGHALHADGDLEGARAAYATAGASGFEGIVALEAGASAEAYVLLADAIARAKVTPEAALFGGYLGLLADRVGRVTDAMERRAAAEKIAAVVRRPWLDATLATLAGTRRDAKSVHARIALRIASAHATKAESPPAPSALVVAPAGAWFRAPNAEKAQPLRARKNLARILDAMANEPARSFTASDLFAVGWPGERALGPSSAHRVRVALATLRKMGLDSAIVRKDDGWSLAPDLRIDRPT